MKKLISILLVLTMCLSMFTACGNKEEEQSPLNAAAEYLYTMYKDVEAVNYSTDYQVVSVVKIGEDTFKVTWTTDADEANVKIVAGETMTTIDVNNENPEEVKYTLTGTLEDAEGNKAEVKFDRHTPAAIVISDDLTPAQLLDIAYGLETGMKADTEATLTGVITSIDTAWSDQYSNITVTMVVEGDTARPIQCFRLKGDGAKDLAVGDTITVTGYFLNYNGKIEFDAGCNLDAVVKGEGNGTTGDESGSTDNSGSTDSGNSNSGSSNSGSSNSGSSNYSTAAEIIAAAYALEKGASLDKAYTLTGVISKINTAFSSQYNNISVTIIVDGDTEHPILCYRLKGDGADGLNPGDTITVTGTLTNYNGTIEFGQGCTLDDVDKTGQEVTKLTDPIEIVKAAYALEEGASFSYEVSLTGTISEIITPFGDGGYENITLVIKIAGIEDKPIICFRLKGDGADALQVGDTITVTGTLMNYGGDIEFGSGCTFVK